MLMPTVSGSSVSAFVVNINTRNLYGFRNNFGTITTSGSVTATPFGGVAPYTYEIEYVSGDADTYPVSPDKATTKFSVYSDLVPFTYTAVRRFKVTDAAATVGYSDDITITLEATYSGGGGPFV